MCYSPSTCLLPTAPKLRVDANAKQLCVTAVGVGDKMLTIWDFCEHLNTITPSWHFDLDVLVRKVRIARS